MKKSTNLYVRVEPDVKETAEIILSQLGIPMSNAIGMFLKQVILHRGLPFNVVLPSGKPPDNPMLAEKGIHAGLEKDFIDINIGNALSAMDEFKSLPEELDMG